VAVTEVETNELWKEFEDHMRKEDERPSTDITVGGTDKGGNLLILGGQKDNLWRLSSGLYEVATEKTALATEAIKLYNLYNNTSLREDYISTVFYPWYEKQFKVIAEVPSDSTPGLIYKIRRTPDSKLVCDPKCIGFRIRGKCKHVDYIKAVEQEASK